MVVGCPRYSKSCCLKIEQLLDEKEIFLDFREDIIYIIYDIIEQIHEDRDYGIIGSVSYLGSHLAIRKPSLPTVSVPGYSTSIEMRLWVFLII